MIKRLVPQPGVEVSVDGRRCQITQVLDLERVLVRDMTTGEAKQVCMTELQPTVPTQDGVDHDTQQIDEAHWQCAQARFAVIRPLLEQADYSRAEVEARARASGYSTATVYRWLRQYQRGGVVSALVPSKRGSAHGQRRLPAEVNTIVDATIDDTYLSDRKPSIRHTALEVERRCRNAGLTAPHVNTVRYRIRQLSARQTRHRREGAKARLRSHGQTDPINDAATGAESFEQSLHDPASGAVRGKGQGGVRRYL